MVSLIAAWGEGRNARLERTLPATRLIHESRTVPTQEGSRGLQHFCVYVLPEGGDLHMSKTRSSCRRRTSARAGKALDLRMRRR